MKYNEVTMKGSHNSYNGKGSLEKQILEDKCGCVELDIYQHKSENKWSVSHDKKYYEEPEKQLSKYLNELKRIIKANPDQELITLYLDIKGQKSGESFPDKLDSYIIEKGDLELSDIFSPGYFGNFKLLADAVKSKGWPNISQMRGKILICLSGDGSDKKMYANKKDPNKRLCFADYDKLLISGEIPYSSKKEDEFRRVFFNYHITQPLSGIWADNFRKAFKEQPHAIIRAHEANSSDNWDDCLNNACSIIATDNTNRNWENYYERRRIK
ncbi:hypothetical protein LJC27_02160 [Christensenellaceae bacterium OttesenSCG-928-M15]|nr:hypothetical protein [Christensenellaceae bacterium OttesenSCG-928-M15]